MNWQRIARRRKSLAALAGLSLTLLAITPAHAAVIYGGPTYNSATSTGFSFTALPVIPGNTAGNGTAVGVGPKYGPASLGTRAVRWDATGNAATELGNLGTDSSGFTNTHAFAVNTGGTAVGYANKYTAGSVHGIRAVRWDASGTAASELGNLGTNSSGATDSRAYAVNTAGVAVGYANKYSDGGTGLVGFRPVRWDATGTAATELGNLGTNSGGYTESKAYAINTAGTAVGHASLYSAGSYGGIRAVRWDATGTAATELGNLGTNSSGRTTSYAYAVNTAGTAVGYAEKFDGGTSLGTRAVRWDASGTAATELGHLGTRSNGNTNSRAYAVNTDGTAVGYAEKYTGGLYRGFRAVRWDASGTATELGTVGIESSGFMASYAYAINAAGTAVGVSGSSMGDRAVAWGSDGVALDLNTLLSPEDAAMWTLMEARGITDTGWVTGTGRFDPDGIGGLSEYDRAFLIQVPEPGSLSVLAAGAVALLRRRCVASRNYSPNSVG